MKDNFVLFSIKNVTLFTRVTAALFVPANAVKMQNRQPPFDKSNYAATWPGFVFIMPFCSNFVLHVPVHSDLVCFVQDCICASILAL